MTKELILRNCNTNFYGDEILAEKHKFTDQYFESVRTGGYTAIWITGRLRELAIFEEAPHWNRNNAQRLAALNEIIARGQQHGVNIYLYVNEPRGFFAGDPIFDKYPDLQGPYNPFSQEPAIKGIEPEHSFCTKSTFTERYLTDGFAQVFAQCPQLAGLIMITTSEILSHCYSHVDERNLLNEAEKEERIRCPRCRESSGSETIVDVITKIRNGVRRSNETANIVAWNWSWGMHEAPPQRAMISSLPSDVAIMCDMQRGGSKTTDGVEMVVDEYSFSYLGPSPLFVGTAEVCKETGHELWSKMMVNVTHEFLMTPYLPLFFRLAKKTIAIRDYNSRGWLGCWNYGGDADTPMAQLGSKIFNDESFTEEKIDSEVQNIAQQMYGDRADAAFAAWQEFDAAFEYFPFDMSLIYYGPHMHGPGMSWVFQQEETPMPWYFLPDNGRVTNNLSKWCTAFSPEQIIHFLTKLTDGWKKGLDILAEAFGVKSTFDAIPEFESLLETPGFEDFNYARIIYLHYMSTIAFLRFRVASLDYFAGKETVRQKEIIQQQLEEEKVRIRAERQIVEAYPHIPFQEEAQQMLFTIADLDQRLQNIENFSFEEGQII